METFVLEAICDPLDLPNAAGVPVPSIIASWQLQKAATKIRAH
jgi:hypothetical protein